MSIQDVVSSASSALAGYRATVERQDAVMEKAQEKKRTYAERKERLARIDRSLTGSFEATVREIRQLQRDAAELLGASARGLAHATVLAERIEADGEEAAEVEPKGAQARRHIGEDMKDCARKVDSAEESMRAARASRQAAIEAGDRLFAQTRSAVAQHNATPGAVRVNMAGKWR